MKKYIIALDQGTTSSRAMVFDHEGTIVASAQKELTQFYPRPGYVEQDPLEIYASQSGVLAEVMAKGDLSPEEIAGIGISNQRETTILWEKDTGRPVYNAIVWQCRRTAEICEELKAAGHEDYIRENTGLLIDAYFSGTKIKWILDHVPGLRERAEKGEILFGTVDSWLIWKMTGGAVHVTDFTNASRTMLYNIRTLCWDQHILDILGIPACMLPKVRNSSEIYGTANLSGVPVPIAGVAGDQQAALFGQTCFDKGDAKNTYGTGCFLLMNTGSELCISKHGLVSTIAIGLNGTVSYALEGSVFVGGAVVQWLRDEMRFIVSAKDSEYFAASVEDNGGVYVVPAFTGFGAPHWDMYARGAIFGLTRGSNRSHIIRAALESIAYQTKDVLDAMIQDIGAPITSLRADGGASANNFLMQFQSDIIGCPVARPRSAESTALGAAYLAGLAVGFWSGLDELRQKVQIDRTFEPAMDEEIRSKLLHGWNKAVSRTLAWED